jgi:chromosome segregation ATPase
VTGLLKDLAIVSPSLQTAANQVLFSLLNSVIVVENREVANFVVEHFRTNKLGVIRCEILSELPSPSRIAPCNGLRPLFQEFSFRSSKDIEKVFWKFTRSWWIAETSAVALSKSYEQTSGRTCRRNVVALDGTLYHCWGSIILNKKRLEKISQFLLKDMFPSAAELVPERRDIPSQISEAQENFKSLSSRGESLSQNNSEQLVRINSAEEKLKDLVVSLRLKKALIADFESRIVETEQLALLTENFVQELEMTSGRKVKKLEEERDESMERLIGVKAQLNRLEQETESHLGLKLFRLENDQRGIREELQKIQLLQQMNMRSAEEKEKEILEETEKIADFKVKVRISKSLLPQLSKEKKKATQNSQQSTERLENERKKVGVF